MHNHPSTAIEALIRKLESTGRLTSEMRTSLEELPVHRKQVAPGEMVLCEGDTTKSAVLVLSGCLFRDKSVADGKRQILAFHVAGDIPDLQSLFLKTMDHNLTAAGPAEIALIPHETIRELMITHPCLGLILWRDTMIDSAILREWIVNTGRRRAVSRMAHLLCELMARAAAVGLATDDTYAVGLTQTHFADALGLSMVHVNRSLQELRRAKLIEISSHHLKILDRVGLEKIGDFDTGYLNLEPDPQHHPMLGAYIAPRTAHHVAIPDTVAAGP